MPDPSLNAASGAVGTGNLSWSLTLVAGNNIVVDVAVNQEDNTSITAVTVDGGAATLVDQDTTVFSRSIFRYRRAIGTKSAGNITIALTTGSQGGDSTGFAVAISDVDQVSPQVSAGHAGFDPGVIAVTLTATRADTMMVALAIASGDMTAAASNTDRGVIGPSSYGKYGNCATRPSAAAGSLSVGFSTSTEAGIIAWEVNPAAGGSPFVPDEDFLTFIPSRLT